MQKWTVSILAGIAGIVAGLWFSGSFMISKLFLAGIEVDLSDSTAVAWALANSSKSEWQTYLILGSGNEFVLQGAYWMHLVPAAFAILFFSMTYFLANRSERQKAKPKNPFLKAGPLAENTKKKRAARLAEEPSAGAPLINLDEPSTNGAADQPTTENGQQADSAANGKAEAKKSEDSTQEGTGKAEPDESDEPDEEVQQETEAQASKETEQPAEPAEILEDEVWRTHYDYNDAIQKHFDKLKARGDHLAVDFAKRFMADPNGSDLEELAARVLEEEENRKRFSNNEKVEAAHKAMSEISEDAAAEFRRVIGILGEDADLKGITRKIRKRFPKADAAASGLDPMQMNESQIIRELRSMGFEIIAPSGGPYPVKDLSGDRITKPFNLLELQEFLREKRSH